MRGQCPHCAFSDARPTTASSALYLPPPRHAFYASFVRRADIHRFADVAITWWRFPGREAADTNVIPVRKTASAPRAKWSATLAGRCGPRVDTLELRHAGEYAFPADFDGRLLCYLARQPALAHAVF